ncbi:MAG: hypothetical protein AB8U25_00420 [Rickettsiales endosymbiont of Dermacentor nuttalli]
MVLSYFSFGFLVWNPMIIRLFLFIKNPMPVAKIPNQDLPKLLIGTHKNKSVSALDIS